MYWLGHSILFLSACSACSADNLNPVFCFCFLLDGALSDAEAELCESVHALKIDPLFGKVALDARHGHAKAAEHPSSDDV